MREKSFKKRDERKENSSEENFAHWVEFEVMFCLEFVLASCLQCGIFLVLLL
jgi:hypothetical protein